MPQNDTVQQIKEKLSIVEVIQPYVKLTRAGKYWRGLTPFGKEKTPSFYVSPDRGSYYCFSTSQGGDHFAFIQAMEGVDFKGSLTFLADKAGIVIVPMNAAAAEARDKTERLREAMAAAEIAFTGVFTEAGEAHAYAKKRGLTAESIAAWKLGFAGDGWRGLFETLTAQGFTTRELLDAGLIKEADQKPGTYYDRFRNRLMFPIRDTAGRTVAFTGRALGVDDSAKYLNSPETELFKKSDVLFGMDRAKDAIRTRGFALLVEGQFDLLLMHQAGFMNTVALSGTALSSNHLNLIKRYADNLMLCLDGDRAGLASSAKSAHAALVAGMRVKAIRLPVGKDPADVIAGHDGVKIFTELVQQSTTIIEFFLSVLTAEERAQPKPDDLRLLRKVEEIVLPLMSVVKSPLEQARYIDIAARALGLPVSAVQASLRQAASAPSVGSAAPHDGKSEQPRTSPPVAIPLDGRSGRQSLILATIACYPETPLAERLKSEYARIIGVPPPFEEADERAVFEAGLAFGDTPDHDAANDVLVEFERIVLRDALREATRALLRAEGSGDESSIRESTKACRDLQGRLASLG